MLATVLAAAAGVNDFVAKVFWGDASAIGVGSEERWDEKRSDLGITARGISEHKDARKERLGRRRRTGRAGDLLMIASWAVGMCGYYAMLGRSKKGKFGFH